MFTKKEIERKHGEITPAMMAEALKRPSSFAYWGRDEMFETWSIGPVILTRDSSLRDQSNFNAIKKGLEEDSKRGIISDNNWAIERSTFWGSDWVEHLTFRVIGDDGGPTNEFAWLLRLRQRLLLSRD